MARKLISGKVKAKLGPGGREALSKVLEGASGKEFERISDKMARKAKKKAKKKGAI